MRVFQKLKNFVTLCCVLYAGCLSQGGTSAQEAAAPTSVKPGINESFLDPNIDVESFIARFEVESREIFASRDKVLEALELKPGTAIADIGAGTGFYSMAFANAVGPEGTVYAVEIVPKFLEHIRGMTKQLKRTNVVPVLCDEDSVRLPTASVDIIFSSDVYHHFEYPQLTLASIHRALRPGGRMVVIDFERIEGVSREWTLDHVRAGKETVRSEIEQAGFEYVGEKKIEGFSENYFLEFRRP